MAPRYADGSHHSGESRQAVNSPEDRRMQECIEDKESDHIRLKDLLVEDSEDGAAALHVSVVRVEKNVSGQLVLRTDIERH